MLAEVEAMPDAEIEQLLVSGSYLLGFYRNQRPKEVYLRLSPDCRSIMMLPSKDSREDCKDAYVDTLADVLELRKGQKTTAFAKYPLPEITHKSFSLVWGFRREINVAAETVKWFHLWTVGLIRIISKLKLEDPQVSLVAREWRKQFGEQVNIGLVEVCQLLMCLNAKPKKSLLNEKINEILGVPSGTKAKSSKVSLNFQQFLVLLRHLRQRQTIVDLFRSYHLTDHGTKLPAGEFWKFLQREQGEKDISLEEATEIMQEHMETPEAAGMTLDEFSNYLTSSSNSPLDPNLAGVVTHDMRQPLSHYFISCSHNTYLETNQLTGTSSVDMYIRVLKTGCRCIELDCWDGPDGDPMITHGNTLTSTIRVVDVLVAIRDWGFSVTEYPLILSLELHLRDEQQQRFANLLKDFLGDVLAVPIPAVVNPDAPFLPSPYELRGKVVLKGPSKLSCSALAELIYLKGISFRGFQASKNNKVYEMSSFPEGDVKKLSRSEFVQYNYRFLSRAYPKGTRIDSSNYDPLPAWNAGIQMVALNYQYQGPKLWVENGKFKANGASGYLLKPYYMRQPDTVFDVGKLSKDEPWPGSRIKSLKIKVISARQCPKPKDDKETKLTDPAIELTIEGVPCDCKTYRTRKISNNGFSPEWDKEYHFRFALSEMAVLLVSIFDDHHLTASTRLAYAAYPVDCLRSGFRIISFHDPNGEPIPFCDLLVYITINPS